MFRLYSSVVLKQAVYTAITVRTYGIHVPEIRHQVTHAILVARSKEPRVYAAEAMAQIDLLVLVGP